MQIEQNDKLSQKDFNQQMIACLFKQSNFNNTSNHNRIIQWISKLDIPQDQNQIVKILQTVEQLILYYGTAILICFKNFYSQLQKKQGVVSKNKDKIQNIASMVRNIVEDNIPLELSFYEFAGLSKKKFANQKSDLQRIFLKFIRKLGYMLSQLTIKIKKVKNNQITHQSRCELNKSFEVFFEADCGRKLNAFEANYQNYFKQRALELFEQIEKINKLVDQSLETVLDNTNKVQKSEKINYLIPICCRPYFNKGQILNQPESLTLQYKNYKFPYKNQLMTNLKKTITGFLNGDGGIIFIGVYENTQTKKRTVIGDFYDQNKKEEVLKVFRKIAQTIQPDILTMKLYNVDFVPIKVYDRPVSGKYIIKITIRYGIRDDIYGYKGDDNLDYFAFRTQNQVVHRQGRQVLLAFRQRIKNPLAIPVPRHQGPCQRPQQGKPIYTNEYCQKQEQLQQQQYKNKIYYYKPTNTEKSASNKQKLIKQKYILKKNREYIILNMNEQQIRSCLKSNSFSIDAVKLIKKPNKSILAKVVSELDDQKFKHIMDYICIESKGKINMMACSNKLKLDDKQNIDQSKNLIVEGLFASQIFFEIEQGEIIKYTFESSQIALDAYFKLTNFGLLVSFVQP